ncbi:MAG: hypothetical protein MPJ50_10205 [Pirellulales bacterium]|nr:hypothetical protein [Pirellulales bacterium]
MKLPTPEIASARKAAILISTLDIETADRLLEHLPDALATRVRDMALALDEISDAERDMVIREFFTTGGHKQPSDDPEGVELEFTTESERDFDISDPENSQSLQTTNPLGGGEAESKAMTGVAHPRFEMLRQAEPSSLSQLLQNEHPQTVAVIAAHLPRDRGAQLLAEIPHPRRADVIKRILHLDEMHPEILQELELGLAARFAHLGLDSGSSTHGHTILREILEAAEPQTRSQLRASLEVRPATEVTHAALAPAAASDDRLAGQSGRNYSTQVPEMTFADVLRLSGDALFQVFTAVTPEESILALFDAPESFVERVLDQLSPREARVWRYALANPGPTRLDDVEAAKCRLAQAAGEMAAHGKIDVPFQRMALVA